MKHYKDVQVPARTMRVLDHTSCDLCGKSIRLGTYEVDNVRVSRSVGTVYPEGGELETTEFDVCGPCFATKVIPWMHAQGAMPYVHEDMV